MQSPAAAAVYGSPLLEAYNFPPFKFQPRRESVDWRRISAVDVDYVIRELDVATLQENIAGITFCNLDREACSRCGQPVDAGLLKVLRLAQLTIEYLLHCQDCLSASVAKLEARLQVSLGQQERDQKELDRQVDELKGVREECRRRHKMINILQQLLQQTGAHTYHMCHLCDKIFMNSTFLWGHIQRRHGGMLEGGKHKKQGQTVQEELEELRTKLKWTQGELEAQREAEKQRQSQEKEVTRQREIETKRELDGWIEKERAKLHVEIDKLKKLFWDEFKNATNHNSMLEEGLQTHSMRESNLGSLQDEEFEEKREQAQKLQELRKSMKVQETEWKRKMKQLEEKHAAQKRELQEEKERLLEEKEKLLEEKERLQEEKQRLQTSLSLDKRKVVAQSQHHINVLHAQLQEQAKLIASQEEQIQTMSLRKVEGTHQGPNAVETEEDSSEEDLESSEDGKQMVRATLKQNRTLLKQFRPILEETLEEKLESMGIQREAKGITVQIFRHLQSILKVQREQKAGKLSEFLSLRKKLDKEVTSKVKKKQRIGMSQPDSGSPAHRQLSPLASQKAQLAAKTLHEASPCKQIPFSKPPSQSLFSRAPGLAQKSSSFPGPEPQGLPSTPAAPGYGLSTPPFSSEEDLEGESVRHVSLQPLKDPSRKGPQVEDKDWSDSESSEGSPQVAGRASASPISSGSLVQSMVKNLEKQLETSVKKPAGGVNLFLLPNSGPSRAAVPERKPQLSDDDSDLEISSLEDVPHNPNQREKPKPLPRSKRPENFGASVWSPNRPRVPHW